MPTGDTASRPSAPSAGEWRFNSEKKYVEYWDGGSPGAWRQIDTEVLPATPDDFPSQNFNVSTYCWNWMLVTTIDAKFNEAANFNGSSVLMIDFSQIHSVRKRNVKIIGLQFLFGLKPNEFNCFNIGTVLTL